VANDPLLTGILKVAKLPPQCTFWRFLASLHLGVAGQLLEVQRRMRERVWEAANVRLSSITLDTDTTLHTVYGKQMEARKSYNPKNKGKKSFQPILILWPRRGSISGASCAMATAPTASRSHVTWRRSQFQSSGRSGTALGALLPALE
jgi:hypothetical protein